MKEFLQQLMDLIRQEIVSSENGEESQEMGEEMGENSEMPMDEMNPEPESDELGEYMSSVMTRPEQGMNSKPMFDRGGQEPAKSMPFKKKK